MFSTFFARKITSWFKDWCVHDNTWVRFLDVLPGSHAEFVSGLAAALRPPDFSWHLQILPVVSLRPGPLLLISESLSSPENRFNVKTLEIWKSRMTLIIIGSWQLSVLLHCSWARVVINGCYLSRRGHHVFLDPPVVVVVAGVAADLAVSLTAPVHLALTQPRPHQVSITLITSEVTSPTSAAAQSW